MTTAEVKQRIPSRDVRNEYVRKVLTNFRKLIEAEEARLGWFGRFRRRIADIIRP